jgi:hypothetical protein
MMTRKTEYISLREAAAMSGYTPDYVGQLIRSGKLPGKQVFANVAWMTTEEAVREYVGQKRGKNPSRESGSVSLLTTFQKEIDSPRLVKRLSIALIVISVAFMLMLFYVFSTSLDQRLNQRAIQRLEQQT